MKDKQRFVAFCLVLFLGLIARTSLAQSTFGSIRGTVTDSSGAVVSGVTVVVTNTGTNISKTVITDDQGNYEVSHLIAGSYSISSESSGFKKFLRQGITLQSEQVARIDIQLEVGDIDDVVTVTGEAPLVESETARIADVRTFDQFKYLPTMDQAIWGSLTLTPGAVKPFQGDSAVSLAGSRPGQSQFTIDGITMSDSSSGLQIGPLANFNESLREMRVDVANNNAEFSGMATITLINKSGENSFHGSLFWNYSSGAMRARNPFSNTRPSSVSHGPMGGSFSGPVLLPKLYDGHNRTFFYFSYEGSRTSGSKLFTANTATLAMRNGDFSAFTGQIKDPLTGQAFPNNIIPRERFNPVSLKILERFYPLPNVGEANRIAGNFSENRPQPRGQDHIVIRIDHKISDKNSVFASYTYQNQPNPIWEGAFPTIGLRQQERKPKQFTLSDTHIFAPNMINEFRFGIARDNNRFGGPINGPEIVRELGIQGLAPNLPDVAGLPTITIRGTGVELSGISQLDFNHEIDQTLQFQDNLSWTLGRHALKLGVMYRNHQLSRFPISPSRAFGSFTFSGFATGNAFADFLLGIPQSVSRVSPNTNKIYARRSSWDFFAQDDFKLNQKLTINVGLRYEYHPPFNEKFGHLFNFDPATASIVVPKKSVLADVNPLFPKNIQIVTADQTGYPERLIKTDKNNFAPRVGVAYRPFNSATTVLRAGYGIFYDVAPPSAAIGGGPFISSEVFPPNTIINGVPAFQFPNPFPSTFGALGTQSVNGVFVGIVNPYSQQWNVTFEQELFSTGFRVSYIRTRGTKLRYGRDLNSPQPSAIPFSLSRRPLQQLGNVTLEENGADHTYNALQIEVQRRMHKGLFFQSHWTLAKDLGDDGVSLQNPFDRRAERSNISGIPRQRFVTEFMWDVPVGRYQKFLGGIPSLLDKAIGGWQLTGIVLLQTGQYLTPSFAGYDPSGTGRVGGRPDRIGNGNLPESERSLDRWFDASAFVVPGSSPGTPLLPPTDANRRVVPIGRFGNSARGVIVGPGTAQFNIGLNKKFRLTEGIDLRFNMWARNIFNHPSWGNPSTNISSPSTVGKITSIQSDFWDGGIGPRSIQFGLRLDW